MRQSQEMAAPGQTGQLVRGCQTLQFLGQPLAFLDLGFKRRVQGAQVTGLLAQAPVGLLQLLLHAVADANQPTLFAIAAPIGFRQPFNAGGDLVQLADHVLRLAQHPFLGIEQGETGIGGGVLGRGFDHGWGVSRCWAWDTC